MPSKRMPPPRGTVADMLKLKGGEVHDVAPDATVYDAVERMEARRVGALVVRRGEALVGIISERDYTRKVILNGRASRDTRVEEIMTADVVTVAPATSLGECLRLVSDHHIRHLPVVRDGKVVGVLSVGDLVRAVLDQQADQIEVLNTYIKSDYPN
ncbi:MAG: CBS domain-containing protein [Burkholderiales bacterium]